jgi:cysteine desulfurase
MKPIYLDNNATTPLAPGVLEAMQACAVERFGNPASSHQHGRQARQLLENAREQIAALLSAQPDEVIFTSGATEANNLAIFGLGGALPGAIVTTPLEHPCVLEPIRQLQAHGYTRVDLPVRPAGDLGDGAFPENTRLVCVMLANHETGAILPVRSLCQALQGRAPFHCDAAAATGKLPISFRDLGVNSLTISAHKFHGPKGIGALLVRKGTKLRPSLFGGHQQQGLRPGTEPVPLVVGMAAALAWCLQNLAAHHEHVLNLRSRFLSGLRAHAAPVILNGPEEDGLPHALNLSFPGCQADALLMSLDLAGVACSTGSACSSGSLLPSPVLAAMGKTGDVLHSAMRFSMSPLLTCAEIDDAAERIATCVARLRRTKLDLDSPEP